MFIVASELAFSAWLSTTDRGPKWLGNVETRRAHDWGEVAQSSTNPVNAACQGMRHSFTRAEPVI